MTERSPIAVAPAEHNWYSEVAAAVEQAGGTVVEPEHARGLIWLENPAGPPVTGPLHDAIEWVQLRSAGVDGWIRRGDIDDRRMWTSAKGAYAVTVAEHAVTLLLAGARRVGYYARATSWDQSDKELVRTVAGSTVLVVGAGGIGGLTTHYLDCLGADVIAVTRSGSPVVGARESRRADELAELWPRADFVVIATPASADATHIVDAAALAAMRDDTWIVNVGRGDAIDTDALVAALEAGAIGGAGLDVTSPEPLPDDHPLWTLPNVVITPHVANPGRIQLPPLLQVITDNVARFAAGQQLAGLVDLEKGY